MKTNWHQRVVIGGGGFAGVKAALELSRRGFTDITLISDRLDFSYYPQLYHSATGGSHSESAIPLNSLFKETKVRLVQDKLVKLDASDATIHASSGHKYEFDKLILALGNTTNYFGIRGLEEHSYGIKSLSDAISLKDHIHSQMIDSHHLDFNYVIAGAGPTGVELAGALPEYLRKVAKMHGLAIGSIRVELIDGADRILPRSSAHTSERVEHRLSKLGVRVRTKTKVLGETAEELMISGTPIKTSTVIWASGVTNNPFYKDNGSVFDINDRGYVNVDSHLSTGANIYVLGDNTSTIYSGLAQTAIHDAKFVAANLARSASSRRLRNYHAVRPVSVIPVGAKWAAVEYGPVRFYGRLGWLLRRMADLIGYSDIENLGSALKVWSKDGASEESCGLCKK